METLKLALLAVLIILFLLLVIWSFKYLKDSMDRKRTEHLSDARDSRRRYMEDEDVPGMGYWYNKEDIEGVHPDDRLRYQHNFDSISECVTDLIAEMYDCGLVRTEELYAIAYGKDAVTEDSLIFRTVGTEDEALDDIINRSEELPEVSEEAAMEICEKWGVYVGHLLDIVEIFASDEDIQDITDKLMEYGKNDLSVLLYSPE